MQFLWTEIFFRPLLNLLIGLYNTVGLENLGLAIIWLTIGTRVVLLPFSFKVESQRKRRELLTDELAALQKSYGNNPSVLREEQKDLLKKFKFRRWPKVINLAVQGFILLVLYQVFVGGINLGALVDSLYSWVDVPITINTVFLGIDIAKSSILLSLMPALVLAGTIVFDHGGMQNWNARDLFLLIGFPLATFVILLLLPAVKAVFILTSMLFGILFRIITAFFDSVKLHEQLVKDRAKKEAAKSVNIPHPKDRFK